MMRNKPLYKKQRKGGQIDAQCSSVIFICKLKHLGRLVLHLRKISRQAVCRYNSPKIFLKGRSTLTENQKIKS